MAVRMKTIQGMLEVLDKQYAYANAAQTTASKQRQTAYYKGLKQATEYILSDGYISHKYIGCDENGKHYIIDA